MKNLLKLFLSTLYISAFTFGGGFVIVTFMKKKFVDELHWIDDEEMLDITALAQASPGAIAVNAAILVGWRVGGLWGMIVAVLGTIIPPITILSIISVFYKAFSTNIYISLALKGMQAGVAAIILNVVFDMTAGIMKKTSTPILQIILMLLAFIAAFIFNINVIYIIVTAIIVGIIITIYQLKIDKGRQEK